MNIRLQFGFAAITSCLLAIGSTTAATPADATLVDNLRQGGYVLLMRHAHSPRQAPTPQAANPDNRDLERQLDAAGRDGARAMGNTLRSLLIPIGDVLASPTYRALETVRYAELGEPKILLQLGDGGRSMQPAAVQEHAAWLRDKIAEAPRAGMNTLLVTHQPNIVGALGREWSNLSDGETLLIRPGKDLKVVARIKIDEWEKLMQQ